MNKNKKILNVKIIENYIMEVIKKRKKSDHNHGRIENDVRIKNRGKTL